MSKVNVIVILLILVPFCIVYSTDNASADSILAQGNPQETGELLPDPDLLTEPEVEIGSSSPEFSYNYVPQDENGEVTLIWEHTAGYAPQFGYVPYFGYSECQEFARIKQVFTWEYNQTPATLRISASVQIASTGDFAMQDIGDEMYAIYFWLVIPSYSYDIATPLRIKAVNDLKGGRTYDIQFLLTSSEAKQYFSGSVEMGGVQMYPNDNYTILVGLIPSPRFGSSYGIGSYYNEYEGTVTATITHLSVNALLSAHDLTPTSIQPKYNTTTLWNETYRGLRLEPMDDNSFVHLSSRSTLSWSSTLGRMTSDHNSLWNATPYQGYSIYPGYVVLKVVRNNIFMCAPRTDTGGTSLFMLKLDSQGQELWNRSIPLYYSDIPMFIDVDASGAIYTLALSLTTQYGIDPYSTMIAYSLVKLDSEGNKLWNRTLLSITYDEFATSEYDFRAPKGLGCYGNDIYVGMPDIIQRLDPNGNEVWNVKTDYDAFVLDPSGGFYTCSSVFDEEFQLSRWTTEGSISWTTTLSIDYGSGWKDYPRVEKMEMGPNQLLYLALKYVHVSHVMTITRVTPSGQIFSQDTIYNLTGIQEYGPLFLKPLITDMAVTGDGLVHLAVANQTYYPYPMSSPFVTFPANILMTYELSGPMIITISPIAMIISGTALLIFAGIAWDYFVRRRTMIEHALPVPEKIDPWKYLMGEIEEE